MGLKVLNSTVKADLRSFEAPFSYKGPLYNTRNPKLIRINAEIFSVTLFGHKEYHIKFPWTELDGPGNYGQKTDLDITLPTSG